MHSRRRRRWIDRNARWEWSLQLTVEAPPPEIATPHSQAIAAVDVAWRVWEDGHIRLGVLADTDGKTQQLFLPGQKFAMVDKMGQHSQPLNAMHMVQVIINTGDVMIECENGHRTDQNINVVKNLLQRVVAPPPKRRQLRQQLQKSAA